MLVKVVENGHSLLATGKYCLKYKLGEITEAPHNTLGIFCWDTQYNLQNVFLKGSTNYYSFYKVENIGNQTEKTIRSKGAEEQFLDKFYENREDKIFRAAYMTLIGYSIRCYPAVKVIRELSLKEIELCFLSW